ncbi:MAG: DNA polymerase III subunit chi [Pseudomonadota bacterium]|nr:DNA polymerase III subunit chi [Pseudomonadota bacterium]
MPEFRFLHLERRRLEQALPDLLEAEWARAARIVVQTADEAARDALNEKLWTFRDDSFLPHGTAGDGDPATQPIFLTATDENPNGARLRVVLNPAEAARFVADAAAQVIVLFDARDEETMAAARLAWKALSGAGADVSYWREGDEGEWTRAR